MQKIMLLKRLIILFIFLTIKLRLPDPKLGLKSKCENFNIFIFRQAVHVGSIQGELPDSCTPLPFLGGKASVLLIDEIMLCGC